MNNLEKLTELQNEIGYTFGSLSNVAVLGLMGECGEVVEELVHEADLTDLQGYGVDENPVEVADEAIFSWSGKFIEAAKHLDTLKKEIRFSDLLANRLSFRPADPSAFDFELADLFYYLNAVAIGRGLTIEDLAQMSHDKVMAKRQAGMQTEKIK